MTRPGQADEIGRGVLARASAVVYRYLVLGAFLGLFGAPTLIAWTLLVPDGSNAGLFVAALAPVAPALSAALYAQRSWSRDPDLSPGRALWRGLRSNLVDTAKWWLPVLVLAGVLTFNVFFASTVPGGDILRPVCLVLLAVLTVWAGHLLVATSYFSFRTRDALRVAAAEFFLGWRSTLGLVALLIVAIGAVVLISEAALLLTGWAFAGLLRLIMRPVEADIIRRFVDPASDPA
ncbi:DUF624 domain-containing protein [Microlunatus speluncae]|uniref:DUF624 domain-containing protein n=1 Tax=Microlunatus speluncae TaxID=2594267 RepID=UPI0012661F16|nr:DUF624 domain-containing protein [Microlunatus speluncae]